MRAMIEAERAMGRDARLLVYAHGDRDALSFPVSRLLDVPRVRSTRSGPSLGKIALDVQMIAALRFAVVRHEPRAVIAHNIEAALCARAARVPFVYFAHTLFEEELETYFAPRHHARARRFGRWLDRAAETQPTLAIAPALADRLGAIYAPAPWSPKDTPRVDPDAVVYVGNLDGYQGWEDVVDAFARIAERRPALRFHVGTASDPAPLLERARRQGVAERVEVSSIESEEARDHIYHRALVACVPRRSFGGLPIKLLDALARDVPIVATTRACAGLPLEGIVEVVADDSPAAFADGIERALVREADAQGSRFLLEEHSAARFCRAVDEAIAPR